MRWMPRNARIVLNDLQFSQATKVAVVREFALLQRDPRRIAKFHLVSVASVYRWKNCQELVESAVRRTSIKVLLAELIAAEVTLQWMGLERWVYSVERGDLSDKPGVIEALRVARSIERQSLRPGPALSIPKEVVYGFIRDRMKDFPTAVACEAFGIARSGYYAWLRRASATRYSEDKNLRSAIAGVVAELGASASYRRISERLSLKGMVCSRHRVRRLIECPEPLEWKASSSVVVP